MTSNLSLVMIVLVAVFVLATACSSGIKSGRITDKEFTPAHDDEIFCVKALIPDGRCLYTGQIVTDHVRDRWDFKLKDDNGKTGEVAVNEATFNHYNVGDWFDADPKR